MEQSVIKKSTGDKNLYDYFTLPNGLRVLLVQDNNQQSQSQQMAYVSIAVNCGSFNDPPHRQGLAHFLEHMIFMGSAKYPNESGFSEHIAKYGGEDNAFTENEYTNYQFKVSYDGLQHALELQAHLFAAPLLAKDAMEREIKAVESEFQGCYPYDDVRLAQLLSSETREPNHVVNCFAYGNLKSLLDGKSMADEGEALWADLKAFFEKYYAPSRMTLCVQTKSSDGMKEVKEWVTQSFSCIKAKPQLGKQIFSELPKPGYETLPQSVLPYDPDLMLLMNSIQDEAKLSLIYQFTHNPSRRYVKKSYSFVNQLLGHEGQNSLLQVLRSQELAEGICTEVMSSYKTVCDLLCITINLTTTGVARYSHILHIVQCYIGKATEWIFQLPLFDETLKLADLSFEHAYKVPKQLDNVIEIATTMLFIGEIQDTIRETYSDQLYTEIDRQDILNVLKSMTYAKCKIALSGKDVCTNSNCDIIDGPKKEKWFKTTYAVVKKPELATTGTIVFYPLLPNQFMPTLLTTKAQEKLTKNLPPTVVTTDAYSIHLIQDRVHQKPHAYIQLTFLFIEKDGLTLKQRAELVAKQDIILDCLYETVNREQGYDASLADLQYGLRSYQDRGFALRFTGYASTLPVFVEKFLDTLLSVETFDSQLFGISLDKCQREYKNALTDVYDRCEHNRLCHLLKSRVHNQLIQDYLRVGLSPGQVSVKEFMAQVGYVKILAFGEVSMEMIEPIAKRVAPAEPKNVDYPLQVCRLSEPQRWDFQLAQATAAANDAGSDVEMTEEEQGEAEQMEDEHDEEQQQQQDESEDKENNSCVVMYYQAAQHTFETQVSIALLERIMWDKMFDSLRSKQQLGYYVSCAAKITRGVLGMEFVIQSATHTPRQCEVKIREFLRNFEITQEMFDEYKKGLVAKLKAGFRDASDEWEHLKYIFGQNYVQRQRSMEWDLYARQADYLQILSLAELQKVYDTLLKVSDVVAVYSVFCENHKQDELSTGLNDRSLKGETLQSETYDTYAPIK